MIVTSAKITPRIVVRQKLRPVSVQRVPVSWRNTCWAWIISYSTTKMFHFFKFHIWFTSCAKISRPKIIPCLYTIHIEQIYFSPRGLGVGYRIYTRLRTERKVSGISASNYGHVTCDRREQILTNGPGAADVCRLWHLSPPQLLLPEPRTHALMEPMTVPNAVPLVN